jgi:endonuclease YncB( thermonuclease family)
VDEPAPVVVGAVDASLTPPPAILTPVPGQILSLLALLLCFPLATEAETLTGKVVGVTDGDTITVLVAKSSVKVRLAEIDTPERGQRWAKRAKQALSNKVFGHEVEIRVVNVDRYGRTVGHIWLADRHINREVVREGHAWVYRSYLDDKTLLDDETHAQNNKLGLWSLPEAQRVPPWDWRRCKREPRVKPGRLPDQTFSCSTKRKCGEMTSCAEARFYLEKCGLTRIDGDGDGVPCESLCSVILGIKPDVIH